MLDMEAIKNFSIDKSDWKKVKFGDVVFEPKESVKDPVTEGIEHVVGLEHIDSEDMHLRRSASIEESTTFTKKFSKGDVLFGRRRAYLKKAAKANFEGICSGDITVMRAKEELLLPELLPFIVNNDNFFEYAITHSAGGLSPRVKFKDLETFELSLPPLVIQKKVAELFYRLDRLKESELSLANQLQATYESFAKDNCVNNDGDSVSLDEVIDRLDSGVSVNSEEGKLYGPDKGILKTSSVSYGFFNPCEYKKVKEDELSRLKGKVEKNTIIISRMNTPELVGANAYVEEEYDNLYLPDRLWQTSISRKDINVKFLWLILSSKQYRTKITMLCSGTSNSMKNISKKSFLSLKVCIPNKSYQDRVVSQVEQLDKSRLYLSTKLELLTKLHKTIINKVF